MPRSKKGTASKTPKGLTPEERAAMKEYLKERKAEASGHASGESEVLAKIAEMPKVDREMAQRIHDLVRTTAPDLAPRTWYGMPAYAKDGKIICFFQGGYKFKARYATLGFSDKANLDDGGMWPTSFAIQRLGKTEEANIATLLKQAVS